jgi:hypothetical protein
LPPSALQPYANACNLLFFNGSTIYSSSSSGYGPPFVKLGNLVRYIYEHAELWLARPLELSRG